MLEKTLKGATTGIALVLMFAVFLSPPSICAEFKDANDSRMSYDVDCSVLLSRRACFASSRICTWRAQGSLPGLYRCEQKDSLENLYINPYFRIGNLYGKPYDYSSRRQKQCTTKSISDLSEEACYAFSDMNIDDCGCTTEHEETYIIAPPAPKPLVRLTQDVLLNETMFIFIHANKAAGETVKNIGYMAMQDHHWDGAGYATRSGWQFLEQTFWPKLSKSASSPWHVKHMAMAKPSAPLASFPLSELNRGKIMYSTCGRKYSTFDDVNQMVLERGYSLSQARECPLRFIWGNGGMGLCDHFPGMPCVYFIALRDPLSRALSDYNYFCLDGAEGRKKWTLEMIKQGECNIGPVQWFKSMRTSPFFFVERLTRGCDKNCGTEAALNNLFHPCVRYILVERFSEGLKKLREAFYPAFSKAIDSYLASPKRMNRRGHGTGRKNLKIRPITNATMDRLREWLKEDYVIYDEAVKRYDEQWDKPLVSCNAPLTEYRGY